MNRLVTLLLILCGNSTIASADIYTVLEEHDLLDTYLMDLVQQVSSNVISGSRRGRGLQINGPHDEGRVNIYIVDTDAIRGEPLEDMGIYLGPLNRNLIAHKDTATIFIDSRFLRELVTLNMMFWEQHAKMPNALASFEVNGEEAYRRMWDPKINPTVNSREAGQFWLISLRGVLAFVIAHELGHIDSGIDLSSDYSRPFRPRNLRDRDIYWSCPELVHPQATRWRDTELAADQYALEILARLGGLRYEHGAQWYLVYLLNVGMIKAIPLASSSLSPFLRQRYGNAYDALRTRASATSGPVEAFYPKSHPDVLLRLANSMAILFGEEPDPLLGIWNQRLDQECSALR